MIPASMKKLRSSLLLSFAALAPLASLPALLRAQLVRQDTSPPAQSSEVRTQPPSGKRRISQEVQITGDQSWSDTGIDVRPGEHIVVTATCKLRYADAKEDNGPDGITRSFKDLLQILPFNGPDHGAVIANVDDAEFAHPFLLGASRAVPAPVAGRLA